MRLDTAVESRAQRGAEARHTYISIPTTTPSFNKPRRSVTVSYTHMYISRVALDWCASPDPRRSVGITDSPGDTNNHPVIYTRPIRLC